MKNKTAFIGHRQIFDKGLRERLYNAVEIEIKNGCKSFIMGTHGDFDRMALSVCLELSSKPPNQMFDDQP